MKRRNQAKAAGINADTNEVQQDTLQRTAVCPAQQGTTASQDPNAAFSLPKTPSRPKGNRPAASLGVAVDTKWDPMVSQPLQTPDRQRGSLAAWLASPQTQMQSPCLFASPNHVPLFHPSPRRHSLQSPVQHSSFENIFQSPVARGAALDLLQFETPNSKQHFDGLFSPSPRRSRRLASGSQARNRAVSLEAAGWQLGLPGRPGSGLDEVQSLAEGNGDTEHDLVRDLLQSPGPKEVQQVGPDAQLQTHSRSSLIQQDTVAAVAELLQGAGATKPPAHPRRRALDFSQAESMQHDLRALQARGSSRSSSSNMLTGSAAQGQQQKPQQDLLPLLPLDLSACEKHNPSSPLRQAGAAASGFTPRRSGRLRQHAVDAFTSPRSALDAAAVVVAGGELEALLQSSSDLLNFGAMDCSNQLRTIPAVLGVARPAFDLATRQAAAGRPGNSPLPAMVPVSSGQAAVPGSVPSQQQQQASRQQQVTDILQEHQDLEQQQDEEYKPAPTTDESIDEDYTGSASKKQCNLRQQSTKQQQQEPCRRSRRKAAQAYQQQEQSDVADAAAAAGVEDVAPGSSGRSRRQRSRTAKMAAFQQQQHDEQQELTEQHQPQQGVAEKQQLQQYALGSTNGSMAADVYAASAAIAGACTAAAGAAEDVGMQADDTVNVPTDTGRATRGRKNSKRVQQQKAAQRKGKPSKAAKQAEFECSEGETDAATAIDAGDTLASQDGYPAGTTASELPPNASESLQHQLGLPGITGLQQLLQPGMGLQFSSAMPLTLPLGPTPNRQSATARQGGLIGPGTPDEVRLAHATAVPLPTMRTCHCKKSMCLKLYCECFSNGVFCNGCACYDCRNVESNTQEILNKRASIQLRDPTAFTQKLAQRSDMLTNKKGCKCKKSHCLKKYCECYQMGVRCGELCKCMDCQNQDVEGAPRLPAHLLQRALHRPASATSLTAAAATAAGRMQHTSQYWSLAQALPALPTGATSTQLHALGAAAQPSQAVVLRLSGGPGTPGSQMLCLPLQSPASSAGGVLRTASLAQVLQLSNPSAVNFTAIQPALAGTLTNTPNPPKSASEVALSSDSLRITAKPLLPQFLQAAVPAAAGTQEAAAAAAELAASEAGTASAIISAAPAARPATAEAASEGAAALLAHEMLPTPEQVGAGNAHKASPATDDADTFSVDGHGSAGRHNRALQPVQAFAADSQHWAPQQQQHQQYSNATSPGTQPSPLQRMTSAGNGSWSPAATGHINSGYTASPRSAAGLSSVTSKGRHRLSATSRAGDQPAQQQQQPQTGIAALVGTNPAAVERAQLQRGQPNGGIWCHATAAAAAKATGATAQDTGATSNTATYFQGGTARRQLLQIIKVEEGASSSHWARPAQYRQRQQQQLATAAAMQAVAGSASPPPTHWQLSDTSQATADGGKAGDSPTAADAFATPAKTEPWQQQQQQQQQDGTAISAAGVAAGEGVATKGSSPTQPVLLGGPNGPILALSQRAVGAAAALSLQMASAAAAAHASSEAAGGGVGPAQACGMLVTLVDEDGNKQCFFLPSNMSGVNDPAVLAAAAAVDDFAASCQAAGVTTGAAVDAAAAAATGAVKPPTGAEVPSWPVELQQHSPQPQQHQVQARRAVRSLQGTGFAQLPNAEDMVIDQPPGQAIKQQKRQQAAAAAGTEGRQQQQQVPPSSPCKPSAAVDSVAAGVVVSGRCLRSSAATRTPVKRSTPVKRKAHDDGENQPCADGGSSPLCHLNGSPAKLQHKYASPRRQLQQQQQHDVLLPVQCTAYGDSGAAATQPQQQQLLGAVLGTVCNSGSAVVPAEASMLITDSQQQQPQQHGQAVQQLFVVNTADGQQFLMQAPIGTDPSSLLGPDGSIDASCVTAVPPGMALPATAAMQAAATGGVIDSSITQKQQCWSVADIVSQPKRRGDAQGHGTELLDSPNSTKKEVSPQSKVLLSPQDGRKRDGMFKFSPGCTTVFSPSKSATAQARDQASSCC